MPRGSTEYLGLSPGPALTDIWVTGWLEMSSGNEAMLYFGCWLTISEDRVWPVGWVRRTAEEHAILHLGCLVITVAGGRLLYCTGGLTGPWFVVLSAVVEKKCIEGNMLQSFCVIAGLIILTLCCNHPEAGGGCSVLSG